jgi:hypothetical protein
MRICSMSESETRIENQPNAGGHPDGELENGRQRPRWLIVLLLATSLLVIMAVGAYFWLGRELLQRPFLIVAVVVAWLGALVGITIGSDPA